MARVPKTQTLRYLCFALFSNTSHSSIFRKLGEERRAQTKRPPEGGSLFELQTRRPRREGAATPDLFRPARRIAAGAAGRRNDRHIARLMRWCANFRVNSCGRAEHAVGSRQFVAERLRSRVGGRGALRRGGALLRHRLGGRCTVRLSWGRRW